MPDFTRIFASSGLKNTISDTDYGGGWDDIVGSNPPSFKDFNSIMNEQDSKLADLNGRLVGLSGKNKIINGNFDIWQRSASQTTSGYGSDDRWVNENLGSTKVHSQQNFILGQADVPNNPKFFSRTVVSSVSGSPNYVTKQQRIEGVETFSGQTATLSFWAKADSTKNMATEFVQSFGTGGSPSSFVGSIGVTTHVLTTSWQKFTFAVDIPSIAGKTLGTNNNSSLSINFWFDAGSDFDARTNSLGHQSGTFDIAQVQLEFGVNSSEFEKRSIGEELLLAQRYFEKSYDLNDPVGTITNNGSIWERPIRNNNDFVQMQRGFLVRKRAVPSISIYSPTTGLANKVANQGDKAVQGLVGLGEAGFSAISIVSGISGDSAYFHYTADAEI